MMTRIGPEPEAVLKAIKNEDFDGVRNAITRCPMTGDLGIEITTCEPGHAVATLPASSATANFLGFTHTGALFTLAEQVMAAAANTLGREGVPLNCEIQFMKGGDPSLDVTAEARVIDTQGRIARVSVDLRQGETLIARLTEMVFLRKID